MNSLKLAVFAGIASVSLAGCTTDQYGNQRLSRGGQGAVIGGAGGAVVGALAGNPLAGAALGAAAGGILGVVTEDRNRYEDRNGYRYYYERDGREYRYDERRRRRYGPRY